MPIDDLLERADAARAAGRVQEAAGLYDEAIARCRADGDLIRWTRAVLGAASGYVFGAEPGRLPAQLYDVLVRTTDDTDRARIATALGRCWVYAGQASRGGAVRGRGGGPGAARGRAGAARRLPRRRTRHALGPG